MLLWLCESRQDMFLFFSQPASRMRTSRTFVPVGPVAITSPSATKNEYESLRRRKSSTSSPIAVARSIVVLSAIAPAAGLVPSLPSVPSQRAAVSDRSEEHTAELQAPAKLVY